MCLSITLKAKTGPEAPLLDNNTNHFSETIKYLYLILTAVLVKINTCSLYSLKRYQLM